MPAVRRAELLGCLARATDLGTDQPLDHALTVCAVAAALGEAAGVRGADADDLWHLALLHAIGCTADAPEAAARLGDDLAYRSAFATADTGRPREVVGAMWRASTGPRGFGRALAAGPAGARGTARALRGRVAARGAARARRRRRGRPVARVRALGRQGASARPGGERVPAIARVLHIARDAVVLSRALGAEAAPVAIRERAGGAYDPGLVAVAADALPELLADTSSAWDGAVVGALLAAAGERVSSPPPVPRRPPA